MATNFDDVDVEVEPEAEDTATEETDDSQDGTCATGVAIAFAEPVEDERYYFRSFLPSKVGGKPAWLNARDIPRPKQLQCEQCHHPLKFLLQLYAPLYRFERSHHRILYLFVCSKHECCGKRGSLKVFRSQLPAKNIFYEDFDDAEDADVHNELKIRQKEDALLEKLSVHKYLGIEPYSSTPNCIVCGHYGQFRCSQCKSALVYYCSKQHQKYHWYKQHRTYCKERKVLETDRELHASLKEYTFETFDIIPDIEPLGVTHGMHALKMAPDAENPAQMMARYHDQQQNDDNAADGDGYNDQDLQLLEQQMKKDFDDFYLKFQERISRAPAQILRYADSVNEDNIDSLEMKHEEQNAESDATATAAAVIETTSKWPEPLWMCNEGRIDCDREVPPCAECGGERKFEFQVMPQLLHVLQQGVKDLDWGILAVFSCINSCGDGTRKYFKEFIHCQPSYGAFEHRDDEGLIG